MENSVTAARWPVLTHVASPLRIGLKLSRDAPIESFRQVWRIADEAGFDHCWAFDHLAIRHADGTHGTVFEGWTLLGAMAEATKRTRIGLLVTGMTNRHPALLAKAAVTVDHISGGRLEFGIGAGWAATEHEMFGIDVAHSVGRLSEGLEVIKKLWTEERSNFSGRYYRLQDAACNPKPIQKPYPPVWIGAEGPRMLRIVARHADVWNPSGDGLEAAMAAGRQLVNACHEIDRNAAEIRWATQLSFDGNDVSALVDELRHWQEAGFTDVVVYCSGTDPVRAAQVTADQVLPRVR